jgi:hypothetical protein
MSKAGQCSAKVSGNQKIEQNFLLENSVHLLQNHIDDLLSEKDSRSNPPES